MHWKFKPISKMDLIKIVILALLVNNVVLAQFLGICPFLGVSNKLSTSLGMGAAVIFVMALANLVTYLIQNYILVPLNIEFMQTITFIFIMLQTYMKSVIFAIEISSHKSIEWIFWRIKLNIYNNILYIEQTNQVDYKYVNSTIHVSLIDFICPCFNYMRFNSVKMQFNLQCLYYHLLNYGLICG